MVGQQCKGNQRLHFHDNSMKTTNTFISLRANGTPTIKLAILYFCWIPPWNWPKHVAGLPNVSILLHLIIVQLLEYVYGNDISVNSEPNVGVHSVVSSTPFEMPVYIHWYSSIQIYEVAGQYELHLFFIGFPLIPLSLNIPPFIWWPLGTALRPCNITTHTMGHL